MTKHENLHEAMQALRESIGLVLKEEEAELVKAGSNRDAKMWGTLAAIQQNIDWALAEHPHQGEHKWPKSTKS
ncbi:hypothetical protein UM93_14540 [Psychromicrobium lacuslunae]|uniref:Uncharacterized protein n=1 Tax=Psychromicrobium lacuslunae TaxID=1618207 RepID=A0A0D4C212_9MICC|nr:hypothetical protein UM93_14540 [Psychromicrobium lacuslunae]